MCGHSALCRSDAVQRQSSGAPRRSAALWDLSAIRQAPLVRGTAKALCGFLMQPNTRSVAVVGNGPLKPEQRAEVQGFDKVVRFNALNNRCSIRPEH